MKFSGKFKGCVRETIVNDKGISETEYKAVLTIKNVNCSNKTAYLIVAVDPDGEASNLAYMENLEKPVLRSINADGNGITSTYFEVKYLIHEVSSVIPNCKRQTWKVKYYKLRQC
jgi:hypothetical protein